MTNLDTPGDSSYTEIEKEVIILKAVWELINEMVNNEMFMSTTEARDVSLSPRTMTHQRLFNVLLVDFLSTFDATAFDLTKPPDGSPRSDKTYLYYLRRIAERPQLNPHGAGFISSPTEAFRQWLEGECFIEKVWFPSIGVESDLHVKRIKFLCICGNIAKHSFTALSRISKDIAAILKDNGVVLNREQRYLVIQEFHEWFHDNVLGYHISAIAEFLNNIRWGIYEYLRPEFVRSFSRDQHHPLKCGFRFPVGVSRDLAKVMYWDLMNAVRSEPYVPRFEVTKYLKMRY
jgi:hypothetical protein